VVHVFNSFIDNHGDDTKCTVRKSVDKGNLEVVSNILDRSLTKK